MMTTALLIRHGHVDAIGRRMVGRLPGVNLSTSGLSEVERLRRNLALPLDAVYSSPLERARQTAAPLAADRNLEPMPLDGLTEVDFGDWTGLTFDELDRLPAWHLFNARRSIAPVPNGEPAAQVQTRILGVLDQLATRHAGETFAVVSHADVIRAAVLHYAAIPLDDFQRIQIDTASVTAVDVTATPQLLAINRRDHIDSTTISSRGASLAIVSR
jgi:broad specificity phosphatase PhoE